MLDSPTWALGARTEERGKRKIRSRHEHYTTPQHHFAFSPQMKINDATARYEMRLEKNTRKSDERRVQEDTQHNACPPPFAPVSTTGERRGDGGTAGGGGESFQFFSRFRPDDSTYLHYVLVIPLEYTTRRPLVALNPTLLCLCIHARTTRRPPKVYGCLYVQTHRHPPITYLVCTHIHSTGSIPTLCGQS